MRDLRQWVRDRYGADPLHLLALLFCLALAGYAAVHTTTDSRWPLMLLWFVGALVGHDLLLFPLYALADRSLRAAAELMRGRRRPGPSRVSPLNYLRVPAFGAGLTFLMFFPGIVRQGASSYHAATGQTQQPFLARWLLLCAALFAGSAVLYAVRLRVAARRRGTVTTQREEGR